MGRHSSPDDRGSEREIQVIAAGADQNWAARLIAFLVRAGFRIGAEVSGTPQGVVVLLSPAALEEAVWRERVAATMATRIVPVRLTPVDSTKVPQELAAINWIPLDPEQPDATFGIVMAALGSNPELHAAARSLTLEAEAWAGSMSSADRLANDLRHARELAHVLATCQADPLLTQGPQVTEFVRRSIVRATRLRRRRWATRGGAVVVAIAAIAAGLALTPGIQLYGRNNKAAIGTVGDRALAVELPEWGSLLSGSLLLTGTEPQKELARDVLERTLSQPWSLGYVDIGRHSIQAMAPVDEDSVAVIMTSRDETFEFAFFDMTRSEVRWRAPLDGVFYALDISAPSNVAVATGSDGVSVIDLETHAVRTFASDEKWDGVALTDEDQIVLGSAAGDVGTAGLDDKEVEHLGNFGRLLDLRITADGGARVLAEPEPGAYQLVDGLTGQVLAAAALAAPVLDGGAVVPDALSALIIGPDHQLWTFGADAPLTPTGVAVPDRTDSIVALANDRVAFGGQVEPARVIHLPSRGELGIVCREATGLGKMVPSRDDEVLACFAPVNDVLWRIPDGPLEVDASQMSSSLSQSSEGVTVRALGNRLQIEHRPANGEVSASEWKPVLRGAITALAISPDSSRVVVASAIGEVVIFTLGSGRRVTDWRTPDRSHVVSVGWEPGPVVQTASGFAWAAPDCPDCDTDAGLLAALRTKLGRCWNEEQLTHLDKATRDDLGVAACAPTAG